MPENIYKQYWNVVMIFLMLYVAIFVPFQVSFITNQDDFIWFLQYLDPFINFLFFIDIIINFISAFEDPKTGNQIVDLKIISRDYLTSWFLIDFISCLPIESFEKFFFQGSGNS